MLLLSALAFNTPAAHAQSSSADLPGSVLDFGGRVVDQQLATQSFIGQAPGIRVRENAHEIHIELEADVLFDFDQAVIRPSAAQALHQAAKLIRTHRTGPVRVEGYTDSKGNGDYNQRLSERRAHSVGAALMDFGVDYDRIATSGRGEWEPIASNDSEWGRARNRRVEIHLKPQLVSMRK